MCLVAGLHRVPAHGLAIGDDRPRCRQIIFVVVQSRPHIEKMADRDARIGPIANFRHEIRHRPVRIENLPHLTHAREQPQHRLRHRHQDVRRARRHTVGVVLGDHPALVQDHQPVRVGLREHARMRQAPPIHGLDRYAVETAVTSCQGTHPGRIMGDFRRRQDLAHMLKGPGAVGRRPPVCECHQVLRAWWKAFHHAGHAVHLVKARPSETADRHRDSKPGGGQQSGCQSTMKSLAPFGPVRDRWGSAPSAT